MRSFIFKLTVFVLPKVRLSHASSHPTMLHSLSPRALTVSSSAAGKATTAAPTLSCYNQYQDPDQGILSPYCICDGTVSLPQITPTPDFAYWSLSCAYKTIPLCQSCTSLGFPENKCVTISNCNPQATSATLFSSTIAASSTGGEEVDVKNASFTATGSNQTPSLAHITAAAPSAISMADLTSNLTLAQGVECLLQDAYCSLKGPGHSLDGLRDACVLWDSSCSGNRQLATSQFFGSIQGILPQNKCFFDSSPDCIKRNPPGRIFAFEDVKSWMRSPQCESIDPGVIQLEQTEDADVIQEDLYLNQTCCDNCQVAADHVDVYYWLDPLADTSCLSIIGDGVSNIEVGATTDKSNGVYWGCTSWSSSPGQSGSGSPSIIVTATLTSEASMTYRTYIFNPWDVSPCGNSLAPQIFNQNSTIKPRGIPPSLYPRGHSLIAPNGSVSTAVLGNFTFTSPSIYVNFKGLNAGDNCGTTYIPSTMIPFSLEELSTIVGKVQHFASSQQFNPADLPCPPQSIMSENWYTPLPGVPYRPFFAFPEKVRQVIPFFKYCNAFWFSVFDPPTALVPASALTPEVTTDEPKAPSKVPMPSHVPDPGPKQTPSDEDPVVTPAPVVILPGKFPANDNPSPPANKAPIVADPNAQQPAQSADPPQGEDPTSPGEESPDNSQDQDPANPVDHDPASQGEIPPPTTIQLGQQPNQRPTTIFVGGEADREKSTSGIGALIFNALGRVDPTLKPDGSSDPNAAVADPAASFPTLTVAGQPLTISNPSAVSIAGTVLTPGGAEATIAGTPVSLAPSGNLVVGTSPSQQSSTVLTIAGHTVTANPTSFQIAGTPVKAGGPAVIVSGTAISMGLSGNLVVGGGASITSPPATVFTVGAQRFTADGADLVGSGTTIRAGGPAALVSGTAVSLGSSGVLVVGSTTTTLAGFAQSSVFTVGGQTFTANPTKFLVGGATLSAGGPGIMVNSTLISLNPSGSLLIGTSTIPLQSPTAAVVTTDGKIFTVEQGGMIAVDGVTLSSGGPGTILNGTPISLGSGGLVIGSDTVPLPTINGTASSTFVAFKGAALRSAKSSRWVSLGFLVVMMAF